MTQCCKFELICSVGLILVYVCADMVWKQQANASIIEQLKFNHTSDNNSKAKQAKLFQSWCRGARLAHEFVGVGAKTRSREVY